MPRILSGPEAMNLLHEGTLQERTPEKLESIRYKIIAECEELIEVGARIRPLFSGKEQIGWVRGLYGTERRLLRKWYPKLVDFHIQSVLLATTLGEDYIRRLTGTEMQRLTRVVYEMTERDNTLFPYLEAYVTSSSSEELWHGKGRSLVDFNNKTVSFGSVSMRILTASEHAKIWAFLCVSRERQKQRLSENYTALGIIGAWQKVNKQESKLAAIAKSLIPNNLDPWKKIVPAIERNYDDGWAHSEDDSVAGIQRELKGMLEGDKHEQVMAAFEKQQKEAAAKKEKEIERMVAKHEGQGVISLRMVSKSDTNKTRDRERLRRLRQRLK